MSTLSFKKIVDTRIFHVFNKIINKAIRIYRTSP